MSNPWNILNPNPLNGSTLNLSFRVSSSQMRGESIVVVDSHKHLINFWTVWSKLGQASQEEEVVEEEEEERRCASWWQKIV